MLTDCLQKESTERPQYRLQAARVPEKAGWPWRWGTPCEGLGFPHPGPQLEQVGPGVHG